MSIFSRIAKAAGRVVDTVSRGVDRVLGRTSAPAPAAAGPLPTVVAVTIAQEQAAPAPPPAPPAPPRPPREAPFDKPPRQARRDFAASLGPLDQGRDERPADELKLDEWLAYFDVEAANLPEGFREELQHMYAAGELDLESEYATSIMMDAPLGDT